MSSLEKNSELGKAYAHSGAFFSRNCRDLGAKINYQTVDEMSTMKGYFPKVGVKALQFKKWGWGLEP